MVRQVDQQVFGRVDHAAELHQRERCPAGAAAGLAEEHRAAAVELDQDGECQQHGGEHDQRQGGDDPVGGALQDAAGAAELGLGDLQQGEGAERPDVDPRAGDVGELRRQQQPDVAALELPGELAQPFAAEDSGAGHGDGVGLDVGGGAAGLRGGAEDGDAVGDLCLAGEGAGADDVQAVVVTPVELLEQVLDVADVADGQHPVQTSAAAAGAAQQRDRGEPAERQREEATGQRDQEESAGDVGLGGVRGEGDQRGHPDGGFEQGLDLLGAGADALAVVGAADGEQRDPGGREQVGGGLVEEGDVAGFAEPQEEATAGGDAHDHDVHQQQAPDVTPLPAGGLRQRTQRRRMSHESAPAAMADDCVPASGGSLLTPPSASRSQLVTPR